VLESYQSTGQKLPVPTAATPRTTRRSRSTSVSGQRSGVPKSNIDDAPRAPITPPRDTRGEKLYVLVEDPNNVDTLREIRHLCELNPGVQEIIMVLKDENGKRPLRLPFKVDVTDELTKPLADLLGASCVKVQ